MDELHLGSKSEFLVLREENQLKHMSLIEWTREARCALRPCDNGVV